MRILFGIIYDIFIHNPNRVAIALAFVTMAQVAPPTKLATQSIQVNENLSKYPQTHYGIPKSDVDFASARDSLRDRQTGITSNSFIGQNQKIFLNIPNQQRNLVPDETVFRLTTKAVNFKPLHNIGGTIQRAIREVIIRDGRGQVLERHNDFNLITQILIDAHIPKRVQDNVMQPEGIYASYFTYETNERPVMAFYGNAPNNDHRFLTDSGVLNTVEQTTDAFTGQFVTGDRLLFIKQIEHEKNNGSGTLEAKFTMPVVRVREVFASMSQNNQTIFYNRDGGAFELGDNYNSEIGVAGNPAAIPNDLKFEGKENDVLLQFPRTYFTPYWKHVARKWLQEKEVVFNFQLLCSGIFTTSKHWPLWVSKGLQVEITLDSNNIIWHDRTSKETSIDSGVFQELSTPPQLQVTRADVLYTAVTLTPVMQAALESQYARRGLNFLVPAFHCDTRNVGTTGIIQEDYYNSFAMLTRVYQCCRNQSQIDTVQRDSFRYHPLRPTRRFWEYNRIYMPHWGNDNDLAPIDHYLESRKGINLLGDKKTELISLANFDSDGDQNQVQQNKVAGNGLPELILGKDKAIELFMNSLETEPSGFLTGVDTNNGTLRLRIETNDTGTPKQIVVVFMFYKLITYQDGSPPLVQE